MRRFYDLILRLYPPEYRALFSEEIRIVLDEAAEDRRMRGSAVFIGFVFRELLGLFAGLGAEWMAKFTTFNDYMSGPHITARSVAIGGAALPKDVIESAKRIRFFCARMDHAIAHHDFASVRLYSIEESEERARLQQLRAKYAIIDPAGAT